MPKFLVSNEGPGYTATLAFQTQSLEEHSVFTDQREYVEFAMRQALRDLADKVERMRVDVLGRAQEAK